MKNSGKMKGAGCVPCIRERNALRNTGHRAMAPTQLIPLGDAVGLLTKKLIRLPRAYPQSESPPSLELNDPSYAYKIWPVRDKECDRTDIPHATVRQSVKYYNYQYRASN